MSFALLPEDLRIFAYSNAGGWALDKPQGVHIIHLPTGLEVREDSGKSLHGNREIALRNLTDLVQRELNK